jgi:hypothetical protein
LKVIAFRPDIIIANKKAVTAMNRLSSGLQLVMRNVMLDRETQEFR